MMRYAAILFDLDGTLIETTISNAEAGQRALKAMRIDASSKEYRWLMSRCPEAQQACPLLLQQFIRMRACILYTADSGLKYMPGAERLLRDLCGYKTGIVTHSSKTRVRVVHEQLGILAHIRKVITSDHMAEKGKPDPYGPLLAAERLDAHPPCCILIGDQGVDVEAANAAGMTSCLVRGEHTESDAVKKASIVLGSLAELRRYIWKRRGH